MLKKMYLLLIHTFYIIKWHFFLYTNKTKEVFGCGELYNCTHLVYR